MDPRRGLRLCQNMDASEPSPALLEANQRLHQLRASLLPAVHSQHPASSSGVRITDHRTLMTDYLPSHLGWGSQALTAVLRAAAHRREQTAESHRQADETPRSPEDRDLAAHPHTQKSSTTAEPAISTQESDDTAVFIKLYPELALGMLNQGQAAAGRIWLLLRLLDGARCGNIRVAIVKKHLTCPTSSYYLYGERQLRKLLQAGEGLFWQRDGERLWLRSVGKVAVALGVERLRRRPVALPLAALLGGVGEVKAHFYASFHSGRKRSNPISRETLQKVTHVPARTQRVYEKTAGVAAQRNIAVGERHTAENVQKRAWFHGRAVFDFIDHRGRQGPEKRHYVAWHLPNSYTGCHATCSKGRQKKINQEIGLVKQQARGNDFRRQRLFHPDGAAAAKAYNRDSTKDRYWHQDNCRVLEAGWRLAGGPQVGSGGRMGNGRDAAVSGLGPANATDSASGSGISTNSPYPPDSQDISANGRNTLANGESGGNGRDEQPGNNRHLTKGGGYSVNGRNVGNDRNTLTNDRGIINGREGQPANSRHPIKGEDSKSGRGIIANRWDGVTRRGLANSRPQTSALWWVLVAKEGN